MEYSIRVYKPELKVEENEKPNNLRGFCTITLDDAFCLKNVALKESAKGNLYMDSPRYKDYESGEYLPFYRFTDREFQKEILEAIKDVFGNMTESKQDISGSWGDEELYYNLNVTPIQGNDTYKADVAIRLQDVVAVQQLHIIQAWSGNVFVGMPQRFNKTQGEKEDIAHAINAAFKADLERAIMDEYQKKLNYSREQKQQQRAGR